MIEVQKLSKTYGTHTLFEDVSFRIQPGEKIGFVGPNGTGKTTLFKILLGLEEEDTGSVSLGKERLGYVPQKVEYGNRENVIAYMKEGLLHHWEEYKISDKIKEVELDNVDPSTLVSKLSGGQKTRLAIARLLLQNPTVLLLDEPTNNLDIPGIEWIERFVQNFRGAVFVISHDRTFLDRCVKKIFELDPLTQNISEYTGGYTDFIEERAKRNEIALANFERQERQRKKMAEWIALKKQQLQYYQSSKVARQMHAMETRYEREFEGENKLDKPGKQKKMRVKNFDSDAHNKKIMFKVEDAKFNKVVSIDELTIYARDRIHLQGENGAGKSTFIRMLMGVIKPTEGSITQGPDTKIGYFSQEHEVLDHNNNVLDEFMKHTRIGIELDARKILGSFLFFGEMVHRTISDLSQGQKVKLIVAILTHQDNTFLIFDEPTNHLDLDSREVLEDALIKHKGGFLMVSHDRYFIEKININRALRVLDKHVVEVYE